MSTGIAANAGVALCGFLLAAPAGSGLAARRPPPARFEVDHFWIVVSPGAPERAALEGIGLHIAPGVNPHEGQGTAAVTAEFTNAFIELMWVDPGVPVAPGFEAAVRKF